MHLFEIMEQHVKKILVLAFDVKTASAFTAEFYVLASKHLICMVEK